MEIKVLICGACGKMGKEVVKAVKKQDEIIIVGAVDIINTGFDIGDVAGIGKIGVIVSSNLKKTIDEAGPDVMVDFTSPKVVMDNLTEAINKKIFCVVGTTGFDEKKLKEVKNLCEKNNTSAIIAPNFSIGAVLMMKMATDAAKFFENVEIIELHHDKKLDARSGTAIRTA
jgi:4-hydroxy-tetrahydrodipicolinate reductase